MRGFKYSTKTIEVTAYNYVFVQLSQASQTVTQNYTNTAVGTIANYICGLAGVTVGSMPTLNVSIKFNNTNCFKALQDLARRAVASIGLTITVLTLALETAQSKH